MKLLLVALLGLAVAAIRRDAFIADSKFGLFNTSSSDFVTIFSGSGDWLLTWTRPQDEATIALAMGELGRQRLAVDWAAAFRAVLHHASNANALHFVTDNPDPEAHFSQEVRTLARLLIAKGVTIDAESFDVESLLTTTEAPVTASPVAETTTTDAPVTSSPVTVPAVTASPVAETTTTDAPVTTTTEEVAETRRPEPQLVRVVGHVYFNSGSISAAAENRLAPRGYAGVRVSLTDTDSTIRYTTSNVEGEYSFDGVPEGPVLIAFEVPPGMVGTPAQSLQLRAGGINRVPPLQLKFNAHHLAKAEPRSTSLDSGQTTVIIVVSIASGVLVLIFVGWLIARNCCHHKSTADDPLEAQPLMVDRTELLIKSMATASKKKIQHHGLKKAD